MTVSDVEPWGRILRASRTLDSISDAVTSSSGSAVPGMGNDRRLMVPGMAVG